MKCFLKTLSTVFISITSLLVTINCYAQSNTGILIGVVKDVDDNPLADVNILIVGSSVGTVSTEDGYYGIKRISSGEYEIKFLHIGFKSVIKKNVIIRPNQITRLDVELTPRIIPLRDIVVTPGNYYISQHETVKQQVIRTKG